MIIDLLHVSAVAAVDTGAGFSQRELKLAARTTHDEHCHTLAARGFCSHSWSEIEARAMRRFCPGTCTYTEEGKGSWKEGLAGSAAELEKHREWSKLSLYDYRRFDRKLCRPREAIEHDRDPSRNCVDLEDMTRVRDRGWALRRGMVPPEEVAMMAEYVRQIPEPTRSMCGAPGYQPEPCFHNGHARAFPRFHAALTSMLEGWISSGFHDAAELGWPLSVEGSEFISINPWKRSNSATCLVRALFIAAAARRAPARERASRERCLNECKGKRPQDDDDGEGGCPLRCWWRHAVMPIPRAELAAIVSRPKCAYRPEELNFLWHFRFGETSGEISWVQQLHGWLTITLNDTSGFSGYHGWHQDGPGPSGRYHKVFVVVSKNRSTLRHDPRNHPAAAHKTNLMAVPASARYAQNCALLDKSTDGGQNWDDNDLWQCTPPGGMQPGDAIFFREDVWHRTQDTLVDRLALIVDIYRVPLRTAPRDTHIDKGSSIVESARANEDHGQFGHFLATGDLNATGRRLQTRSRGRLNMRRLVRVKR